MAATYEDFLKGMVLYARMVRPDLTDLVPGSVLRSIFESVAGELELLYFRVADQLENAVQESSYRVWSFDRLAPTAASGLITLTALASVAANTPISVGEKFTVPGTTKAYVTTQAAVFPAGAIGSILTIPVASVAAGASYNTAALTITGTTLAGFSVANSAGFYNGTDTEDDNARLQRFASFIRSMHRATKDALEYGAEQAVVLDANGVVIESVSDSLVLDVSAGLATCYVTSSANALPTTDLITAVEAQVALYKAAGATIDVIAAAIQNQTVAVSVTLEATTSLLMVKTTIQQAIAALFADLNIGSTLYIQQLAQTVMDVPGVVDVSITTPGASVVPAATTRIVLSGTPTVTLL